MLMLTLIVAFAMPTILYCSFVLPDSAISGWVLSAMTLVGTVTGFTLGPVYKKLKKWTLPVAGLFLGVLYVVCALNAQPGSFNLVVYIATFLVGHWGFAIVIPATGNMITNLVPIGAATRAMGFNTAFHQAGCFLATPVATLVMGLLGAQAVTDLLLPCSIVGEFFAVPLMRGSIRFGTVYWKALRALTVLLAHTNYPLIRFACLKARNLIRKDTPGGGQVNGNFALQLSYFWHNLQKECPADAHARRASRT